MSETDGILEGLPVLQRLALSYAPSSVAQPTLALLALDTRLAGIVRSATEPMLAQLRLAWWREQLNAEISNWPQGEPLLAVLATWEGRLPVLAGLIDGWEEMTGEAPLAASALERLADARGNAFAALAEQLGSPDERNAALRQGRNWAIADIAAHLSHPQEQRVARELAAAQDWRGKRLPRRLRPLAVLHGLAARATRRGQDLDQLTPSAMFTAMRLGMLGR